MELKAYILKVTALLETDNPASEFLTAALLRPLSRWTDTAHSYRDTVVDEDMPINLSAK